MRRGVKELVKPLGAAPNVALIATRSGVWAGGLMRSTTTTPTAKRVLIVDIGGG